MSDSVTSQLTRPCRNTEVFPPFLPLETSHWEWVALLVAKYLMCEGAVRAVRDPEMKPKLFFAYSTCHSSPMMRL